MKDNVVWKKLSSNMVLCKSYEILEITQEQYLKNVTLSWNWNSHNLNKSSNFNEKNVLFPWELTPLISPERDKTIQISFSEFFLCV